MRNKSRRKIVAFSFALVGVHLMPGLIAPMDLAPPVYAREAREAHSPVSALDTGDLAKLHFSPSGIPLIEHSGDLSKLFSSVENGRFYTHDHNGSKIYFSLDADLQTYAQQLLSKYAVLWGAIVALDPRTGRLMALAGHSEQQPDSISMITAADFKAASLFKLITAAAAVEESGMSGDDVIFYRGGNYTLSRRNYLPDNRRDKRKMSLADALGKSCNPAFARVALNYLSPLALEDYAHRFGFNEQLPFEILLESSSMEMSVDPFNVARTAAGFGDVTINPVHAALLTSVFANRGTMMRPYLVESIVDSRGALKYKARPSQLGSPISASTAHEVLQMMRKTVTSGTARRVFRRHKSFRRGNIQIAAKTGTLRGDDQRGTNYWFVATAPAENPEIALAALVIDPGGARVNGSGLGTSFLDYYVSRVPHR